MNQPTENLSTGRDENLAMLNRHKYGGARSNSNQFAGTAQTVEQQSSKATKYNGRQGTVFFSISEPNRKFVFTQYYNVSPNYFLSHIILIPLWIQFECYNNKYFVQYVK